jgi:hypothetical protein
MAKKNTKTIDQAAATPPAAPAKRRRAPAQKKAPAASPVDIATVGGIEAAERASDTGRPGLAGASENNGEYQPSHDEIAQAAYFRHLNRGGEGDEFNDWLEAERELRSRRR